jgi:hypothetical protein
VNVPLDQAIRRVVKDPVFRNAAVDRSQQIAEAAGVAPADLEAILAGELLALYRRGAHPLLIMQLAASLGIDPMERLTDPDSSPPPSPG